MPRRYPTKADEAWGRAEDAREEKRAEKRMQEMEAEARQQAELPAWGVHQLTRTNWFWAAWQHGADAATTTNEPWKWGSSFSESAARREAIAAAGAGATETTRTSPACAYHVLKRNRKL